MVCPLIVVVPLLGILAWVVISDSVGEPRMIDGRPDDAPRMAAMFLGVGVFCMYAVYLVCLGIVKVIVNIPSGPKSTARRE